MKCVVRDSSLSEGGRSAGGGTALTARHPRRSSITSRMNTPIGFSFAMEVRHRPCDSELNRQHDEDQLMQALGRVVVTARDHAASAIYNRKSTPRLNTPAATQ
jgi:hypothetical protein